MSEKVHALHVGNGHILAAGTGPGLTVARYHQDDRDSDGVSDGVDNCVLVANPGQTDVDGDGAGDACDGDDDGDGVADANDPFPRDPARP